VLKIRQVILPQSSNYKNIDRVTKTNLSTSKTDVSSSMLTKMKILTCLTSIATVVFLTACASQTVTYWEKQGASSQDFNVDQAQCNAQAFSIPNSNYMQIAIVQNQCLRGKGWYLVERKIK
jgi:hypothetical protein